MDFQPKYQPQEASPLFADGRAMRPPVPGTIAQGDLEADDHFYRGREPDGKWATTFPIPVNAQTDGPRPGAVQHLLRRLPRLGRARATACVQQRAIKRGEPSWVPPLSLHVETVVDQPVGQIFNTITNGIRTMPAYGVTDPRGRPLGDHALRPGAPAEPDTPI